MHDVQDVALLQAGHEPGSSPYTVAQVNLMIFRLNQRHLNFFLFLARPPASEISLICSREFKIAISQGISRTMEFEIYYLSEHPLSCKVFLKRIEISHLNNKPL